jgi:hypothetical protein
MYASWPYSPPPPGRGEAEFDPGYSGEKRKWKNGINVDDLAYEPVRFMMTSGVLWQEEYILLFIIRRSADRIM